MHRDRAIGVCLIVVCLTVVPVYLLLVLFPAQFLHFFGIPVGLSTGIEVRIYAALVPVIIGVVALLVAGAWIGISILTSPAPKESEDKEKPSDNLGHTTMKLASNEGMCFAYRRLSYKHQFAQVRDAYTVSALGQSNFLAGLIS